MESQAAAARATPPADDGLREQLTEPCEGMAMTVFYDRMAQFYHLIFQDWDESIERQAGQLAGIVEDRWGTDIRSILDVTCGIGTQAIGLARRGYSVTASDLSAAAIARARAEARGRQV